MSTTRYSTFWINLKLNYEIRFNFFNCLQLLGVTVRADIPLGLDLLPVFWKNLVGLPLDPITDLQEADILTYNYIKKFEMVS